MAKSHRTCYFVNRKEFWSPRPLRFHNSNKRNKTLCHRVERREIKRIVIRWEIQQL